jgi:DNA-binding transcriptional ArsR family regulator
MAEGQTRAARGRTKRDKALAASDAALSAKAVKAASHPLRLAIWRRACTGVVSPVQLSRELDESVQLVSYHVRILRDCGIVELVGTTPRRGALEHHYRAVRKGELAERFERLVEDAGRDDAAAFIDRLLEAHPLPWRRESDWTEEVHAEDGAIVGEFASPEAAEALIAFAESHAESFKTHPAVAR